MKSPTLADPICSGGPDSASRIGSFACFDVSRRASLIFLLSSAALLEKAASSGSPASPPVTDTHLGPSSPLSPLSCPGTPPAQEDGWRQDGPPGAQSLLAGAPPWIDPLGV